jgi:hypothetical protein
LETGTEIVICETSADPARLLESLLLAEACLSARAMGGLDSDAVVAVVQPDEADRARTAALLSLVCSGPVLMGAKTSDADLRKQVGAASPSGRARIVATSGSARDAAKAAERGGFVCVVDHMLDAPSVTEFVQRELCIVTPRDVGAFVLAAGGADAVQDALADRQASSGQEATL